MNEKLIARMKSPGPKKILALDGGGIRGMMTVEVLAEIEALLRKKLARGADFVLADYFDFVAGTSTGAIIAACVSTGMKVSDIRAFYISSGEEMFDKASLLKRFRYKYEDEKLAAKMQEVFGKDTTLGSDKLKTVLERDGMPAPAAPEKAAARGATLTTKSTTATRTTAAKRSSAAKPKPTSRRATPKK